jgi:nitronate monooxygenase
MGGAQRVLHGVLERTKGLVSGVTCGAGMPYKLSEIAASYGVNYLPIISSARAFRALWKRAYHKAADWLAAVVYEDPWLAGGHNGLSNAEDPRKPQDPYPRVKALRDTMRENGIADSVPIVMAGGVWRLDEWDHWIDNPELGQIVFQFGTRPLLTQESPIPPEWKARLMNLEARSERQIAYTKEAIGDHHFQLDVGIGTKKNYWVTKGDLTHAREWYARGFTNAMKTPDDTLIFVKPDEEKQIRVDQAECMGCLSQCGFSSWADNEKNSTGRLADPRSFCIQKTLQDIAHGGPVENNLMFAGHAAFRFKSDPFYSNGFVPTVKQLVDRILTGA